MGTTGSLVDIDTALDAISRRVQPLPVQRMKLSAATGLTLASPIHTDQDYPPFDRTMMDGFAVRTEDLQDSPTTLNIVEEIAAGSIPQVGLQSGEAARVNTGSPVPPNADAVVMIERVQLSPDGRQITTDHTPTVGENIAHRGSGVHAGDLVLTPGMKLTPSRIAGAAAAGAAHVDVFRRPRLALIVTGSELVPVDVQPSGGQIRNSNGLSLHAQAVESGCEVIDLGVVGDDPQRLEEHVTEGLTADLLCVTGGVSMGQHDHVPSVLEALGVDIIFHKLAIKPGKPTLFGIGPKGQVVFGLPGNPVSCLVCFMVLVRAALARLQGRAADWPAMITAALTEPLPTSGTRPAFMPARLESTTLGQWTTAPVPWTGSGDPFGPAAGNAFIYRAANAPALAVGEPVDVMPTEWPPLFLRSEEA